MVAARGDRGSCLGRVRFVGAERVETEQETPDQGVPRAGPAHLYDEDLELTQRHGQDRQLSELAGLSGGLLQLIAIDVMHEGEIVAAADRAPFLGRLTVEPSCVFEVWR